MFPAWAGVILIRMQGSIWYACVPCTGGGDSVEDFATYLLIYVPRMAGANPGIRRFSEIVKGNLA